MGFLSPMSPYSDSMILSVVSEKLMPIYHGVTAVPAKLMQAKQAKEMQEEH